MDSAYDAPEIKAKSLALGHVPIIDPHSRNVPGGKKAIAAEARGRRNAGYVLAVGSLRLDESEQLASHPGSRTQRSWRR
jgi:hypothetical protein